MSSRYASNEPTRSVPRGSGDTAASWLPQLVGGGHRFGERRTDKHDHLGRWRS